MKRVPLLLSVFLLVSCAVKPPQKQAGPITLFEPEGTGFVLGETGAVIEGSGVATGEVAYGTLDGKPLKGYLAVPPGEGPFPALVLIHEWWGLNDNIMANAQAFAREGYIALAVDLYEGESAGTDQTKARELAGRVSENMERAFDNLREAVAFLRSDQKVDKNALGSVGWCFGGGWSYQMAKNDLGIRATVMYYGRFNTDDDLTHMKSQIIGHFGEKDTGILVDTVREFRIKLQGLSGAHEIYIYPNAGYGFANNDNPAFDPAAADVAWDRTKEFLEKTLK
ncbi:MAG: dienelactone hydrolase family protein [Patescibacteria group bacterium]